MKKPYFLKFTLTTACIAIIIAGTGCSKQTGTTPVAPSVTTTPVIAYLTTTTANGGGMVTGSGTDVVTAAGVCYSATNQNPTLSDGNVASGTSYLYGTSLTGLTAGTTYYMRAYATSSAGTGYGGVVKFTTSMAGADTTATVTTLAGNSSSGFTNGTGINASFNSPQGICADAAGNLYVSDSFNHVIRRITPAGVVTTFAGSGNIGFTSGTATSANFYSPQGITTDASGNLYVADQGNNAVYKITPAGAVTILAGSGVSGYTDGTGSVAAFSAPQGITADAAGNVYVADRNNNRIRKITPAGIVTTFAGSGTSGNLDGDAATACFKRPTGVAVDAAGNVYVADQGNSAIRKISPAGSTTTLIGATSLPAYLNSPYALAVDAQSNLYITDQGGRILTITNQSILYRLAGKPETYAFADGTNASALFSAPAGIALDASKNIYVSDYNNHRIRKLVVRIK